jgi:hypothetical protein
VNSVERLEELRVAVRYHRERRDIYRARVYGRRPTSLQRLKELEQACALAERLLAQAESEDRPT